MRLSTLEAIRKMVRFDSIPDLDNAFDQGLLTATSVLESALETNFTRQARTEYFMVEHQPNIGGADTLYLSMENGFIDSSETITIVSNTTKNKVDTGNDNTDLSPYTTWDYDKGTVYLSGVDLDNKFIKVTYTAGFEQAGDPLTYSGVPAWLERAAAMRAIIEFDELNPGFRAQAEGGGPTVDLETKISEIIAPHVRYHPYALERL